MLPQWNDFAQLKKHEAIHERFKGMKCERFWAEVLNIDECFLSQAISQLQEYKNVSSDDGSLCECVKKKLTMPNGWENQSFMDS